jgi:hypothetical protein
MQQLRWYKQKGVEEVIKDYDYLVKADAEYFFDEGNIIKDKLSEIRPVGSNDQYHLVCVSIDLVAVHIVDFMNWNNIPFDADKYVS